MDAPGPFDPGGLDAGDRGMLRETASLIAEALHASHSGASLLTGAAARVR